MEKIIEKYTDGDIGTKDKIMIGLLLVILVLCIIFFYTIQKKVDSDRSVADQAKVAFQDSVIKEKNIVIATQLEIIREKNERIDLIDEQDSIYKQLIIVNNNILRKLDIKSEVIKNNIYSSSFTDDSLARAVSDFRIED